MLTSAKSDQYILCDERDLLYDGYSTGCFTVVKKIGKGYLIIISGDVSVDYCCNDSDNCQWMYNMFKFFKERVLQETQIKNLSIHVKTE